MAKLTITSDVPPNASITFEIGPMDALKLISEYEKKYPNKINEPSVVEFIQKWCIPFLIK